MAAKRILVVEDNLDNRRILVYRLKRIGEFEILEASNGEEALAIVQSPPPPDLIFMDLKMPVMDGWEATSEDSATRLRPRHSDHRPDRAGHGRRRAEGPRGWLRRLSRQADRRLERRAHQDGAPAQPAVRLDAARIPGSAGRLFRGPVEPPRDFRTTGATRVGRQTVRPPWARPACRVLAPAGLPAVGHRAGRAVYGALPGGADRRRRALWRRNTPR